MEATLKNDFKTTRKLEEFENKKIEDFEKESSKWEAKKDEYEKFRIELIDEGDGHLNPGIFLSKEFDSLGIPKMNLYVPEEMEVNIIRKEKKQVTP